MANLRPFLQQGEMRAKFNRNLWVAALSCCIGSVSFGFMIGYSSPAVPDMEWQGVLDKTQLSWFSSLVAIGAIPGCLLAGQLLELLGRKWTMILSAIPYIVGWLSIAVASSAPIFFIGRCLTGFATGIVSTTVPVYLAEISTKEVRGQFGALNQLGIVFGILVAYWGGLESSYWQLAILGLIGPMVYAVLMMFMPETPRWLMMHRTRGEAKAALAWLRTSYTETDRELAEMEQTTESTHSSSVGLSDFLKAELRKPLYIAVGLMIFQQLSGINAVMFNIVDMFLEAGFRESGNSAAVIVGIVQFITTLGGCLVIDKWGRRFMLISAGFGMGISCFIFAYYYHLDLKSPDSLIKYTPLLSLSLFIIAFSLGWGPVPSIVMSEVFPDRARGMASSIAIVFNWILTFIITKNYISMKETLGKDGTFTFFGISIILGAFFVNFLMPETRGKSLEEIQSYFTGGRVVMSRK